MSVRIIENKSQLPWKIDIVLGAPPWIIEHPQPLPIDHPSYLCENCRRYNFGWLLSHDLNQTFAELRKENRRIIETHLVRSKQEREKAGLVRNLTDQEARDEGAEYAKKIGRTLVTTQNNTEMLNLLEKEFDSRYCGNGTSVQRGANGNTNSSCQMTHFYDQELHLTISTSDGSKVPDSEFAAGVSDSLQHGPLQRFREKEKRNWRLKPFGFTTLWKVSEDLYLDQIFEARTGERQVTLSLCPVRDLLVNRNCVFCRLVVRSFCIKHNIDDGDINPDVDLEGLSAHEVAEIEAIDPSHGCFITTTDKGRGYKLGQFEISVSLHPGRMIKNCSSFVSTIRLQDIREFGAPHSGRVIRNQINFKTIQKWIKACAELPASPKSHGEILLIDFIQRCIVRSTCDQRYFALSYVWGDITALRCIKSNLSQLYEAYSLDNYQSQIPQVIKDAMHLISRIGERYLWVDCLCIVQDDEKLKHEQISRMNVIYQSAFAVIVAAYGDNADAGLPGVQSESYRWTQCQETVQGFKLANYRGVPNILATKHSERAWTFQEIVLARRALVFSKESVWFRCEYGFWEEDRAEDFTVQYIPQLMGPFRYLLEVDHQSGRDTALNFQRYALAVQRYTKRKLTYSVDMLNAFTGITNALVPSFRGEFIYGLPCTEIDVGLLWTPYDSLNFRTEHARKGRFPTWSWSAWDGPVSWESAPTAAQSWQYRVHSRVTWIDSCNGRSFTSGQYRGLDAKRKTNWTRISLGTFNECSQVRAVTTEDSQTLFLHAVEKEEDRIPRSFVNSNSCVLTLEARVAGFFVSHNVPLAPESLDNKQCDINSPTSCCSMPILDSDLFHAGYIRAPHLAYASRGSTDEGWSTSTDDLREGKLLLITLMALSRTHGTFALTDRNREIALQEERQPPPRDDSDAISIKPVQMPSYRLPTESNEVFDERRFPVKPWCVYNVMLLGRVESSDPNEPRLIRLGIGVCHIDAFHQADPQHQRIYLA